MRSDPAGFDSFWKWGPEIGSGHFGTVYRATDRETRDYVAVKCEGVGSKNESLPDENEVYYKIHARGRVSGVPRIIYFGRYYNEYIMVMEYLGRNLDSRRRQNGGRLSEKSVCMIALQVLRILEDVHNRGYIHSDIKPDNLLTDAGDGKKIYVADFGIAKRIKNSRGEHVPFNRNRGFGGTLSFASKNSHLGFRLSRRDDLESLGYTLYFLLHGHFPWDHLELSNFNSLKMEILSMKSDVIQDTANPNWLRTYFSRVMGTAFAQRPDYGAYKRLIKGALSNRGFEEDRKFEWVHRRGPNRVHVPGRQNVHTTGF